MTKQTSQSKKNRKYLSKEKLALVSAIVFIIVSLTAVTMRFAIPTAVNEARKNRIAAMYEKIDLGSDYLVQSQDIFGEKRPYEWDKSRSYSSSKELVRGKNVDETVKDLQEHVTKAGFTLIDHPYPYQWQYKSDDAVYVRFNVLSKPRMEYIQNQSLMGKDVGSASNQIDSNTGPSLVTLKVNLDDNNE